MRFSPARPALRRAATVVALGTAMVAALAACGTSSSPSSTASGKPVSGGTLTVGVGMQITNFDPYEGSSQNNVLDKTVYSNLIRYDDKLQPQPDVATKWTFDPGDTGATITLRDTQFADGTPLTSNDVVAGITRAKKPDIGLTQLGTSSFIQTAAAPDAHTVKLTFTGPTSQDIVFDWMFYFPVVEAAKNDPVTLKAAAFGSGPFIIKSYDPGTQLTLAKNPNYYQKGHPFLDSIVFRFFDDQDGMVSALQSGDVQGTLWQDLHYDQQLQGGQYQLIDGNKSAEPEVMYVNPTMAPFDNVDCRKAVFRAVDRQRMLTTVQGKVGQIIPGPFPPASPAYNASLLKTGGYDLAAATKGIAQSCATKTATATVPPDDTAKSIFTILQADLKKAGFDLQLQNVDNATFLTSLRAGKVQMDAFPTTNPFRSPATLTTNRGFSPDSTANYLWRGVGVPADYVAAVTAVRSATTPDQVKAGNQAFDDAVTKNSWATGIFTTIERFTMDSKVKGFYVSPANQFEFGDTYIEGGQ